MSAPIVLTHCRVDLNRRVAEHDDAVVRLTTREAALLSYLTAHPNRTVGRDEIHAEVWGYGPAIITRAADDTLRRLRPKLGEDPKAPIHIFTVHGEGYRYVPLASQSTPVLDAPTQGIPQPRTRFFGRTSEFLALMDAIESGAPLTTLLGPGGVGKTRLALECGQRLLTDQRHVWFVDCSDATDSITLIEDVVRALGMDLGDVSDADAAASRIGAALAAADSPLLLLDNLEQVRVPAAHMINRILTAAPGVQIMGTSRFRLELEGERLIALGPMDLDEGAQLFEDRAKAMVFDLEVGTPEAELVAALVERLDGLPLAIELAAARTLTMSIAELSEALVDGTRALRGRSQGRPNRHQTLDTTLKWTWDLLDPWAQSALAQCAVFRHDFALWAAEAVIDLSGFPDAPPTDQVIETLVDCSLIHTSPSAEQSHQIRFSLYETVRHFAKAALDEGGQEGAVQARMRTALLEWVEPIGDAYVHIMGDDIRRRVSTEFDNLIAIARHAPTNDERARALVAVGTVVFSGHFQTVTAWDIVQGIDFDSLAPPLRAEAQVQAGRYATILGRLDAAIELVNAAIAGAREQGLSRTEAQALELLSTVHLERSEVLEAQAHRAAALEIARKHGDATHIGSHMIRLASFLQQQEHSAAARDALREARRLIEGCGMEYQLGFIDVQMAKIERTEGRLTEARAQAHRALTKGQAVNDPVLQMMAWSALGSIELCRGADHAREAIDLHRHAHDLALRTFYVRAQTYTADGLATALHTQGLTEEAVQLTRDTLEKSAVAGLTHSVVKCQVRLAKFATDNGSWNEAEKLCHEALGPARTHGPATSEAEALQLLAQVLYETGRIDLAAEQSREAVRLYREHGTERDAVWALIICALCALQGGDRTAMAAQLDEAVAATPSQADVVNTCVSTAFHIIGLACTGTLDSAREELESIHVYLGGVHTEQFTVLVDIATAFVERAAGDSESAERRVAAASTAGLGAEGCVVNPSPGGRYPAVRIALHLYRWSDED